MPFVEIRGDTAFTCHVQPGLFFPGKKRRFAREPSGAAETVLSDQVQRFDERGVSPGLRRRLVPQHPHDDRLADSGRKRRPHRLLKVDVPLPQTIFELRSIHSRQYEPIVLCPG